MRKGHFFSLSAALLFAAILPAQTPNPLPGVFSVSYTQQVYFSDNTLTYQAYPESVPEGWRLLTDEEWQYLLDKGDEGQTGEYLGPATVGAVHGLVLVPDNWWTDAPDNLSFRPGMDGNWATNSYTATQWEAMEAAGAVFLPADGYSTEEDGYSQQNQWGYFWTATPGDEENAHVLYFSENSAGVSTTYPILRTASVRLVKDKPATPTDLENVRRDDVRCTKVVRDGQLYLMYQGTMYDVQGRRIKD